VDAQLEVLAELLVELLPAVLVLGQLVHQLDALLDQVLADDLEDLVLLEHLPGDVEGQVLGVDDALDEVEVLGDELLAVVHDEDAPDIELDVVLLLLVLEEVEGGALGDEEEGAELELALDREVLDGQVLLPVVGEGLVELAVLLLADVVGVAGPDGLRLVKLFVFCVLFFDGLFLLLVAVALVGVSVLADVLDLGCVLLSLFLLSLLLGLVVGHLLVPLLLHQELDGIADELGVLLDDILDPLLLVVLCLVLLEVEDDLGAAAEGLAVVGGDGEGAAGAGLPHVLLVVVVFGGDNDLIGHEVS